MACSRSLTFARIARDTVSVARRHGLAAPAFRSPPPPGMDRSLRRTPAGAVVSVRLRDRDWVDVAADVVDGILAANSGVEVAAATVAELRAAAEAAVPAPTG